MPSRSAPSAKIFTFKLSALLILTPYCDRFTRRLSVAALLRDELNDEPRRLGQVLDDEIGMIRATLAIAVVDEERPTPGRLACPDIAPAIPDHEAARKIDIPAQRCVA